MAGVAYAVTRGDPPEVYLASDVEVLERLLALEVVARLDASTIEPGEAETLRSALLAERWGEAVSDWISITGVAIDVYTHLHIYTGAELPSELIGAQLQFAPLFRDR